MLDEPAMRERMVRPEGVACREDAIEEDAGADAEPFPVFGAVEHKEEWLRVHQVWRDLEQDGAFGQRFVHQVDVALLQVTNAAVDHPAGTAAGAPADGVLVDQRDREAAEHGVAGDAGADDAAAEDEEVGYSTLNAMRSA